MTTFAAINSRGVKRLGRLGPKIGDGGEGTVYLDGCKSGTVVKIYKSAPQFFEEKVESMIQLAPRGQLAGGLENAVQIAWPQEMVFDDSGRFLGYTMRAVDIAKTASLNHLGSQKSRARIGIRDDYQFRVYVASNIASVVAHIHDAEHWLIDMKPDNMRLYPDTGQVCVIDTDGFNVKGRDRRFPPAVVTPGYICPEAKAGSDSTNFILNLDEFQDRFALAIILFRLLANVHPCMGGARDPNVPADEQGRIDDRIYFIDARGRLDEPPTSIFQFLESDTQKLFRAALLGAPQDRPAAADWRNHLIDLIESSVLRVCRKSQAHFKFTKTCPWCNQESALKQIVAKRSRKAPRRITPKQVVAPAPPAAAVASPSPALTSRPLHSSRHISGSTQQKPRGKVHSPGRLQVALGKVTGAVIGFLLGLFGGFLIVEGAGQYWLKLSFESDFEFGVFAFCAAFAAGIRGLIVGFRYGRRKPKHPIMISAGGILMVLLIIESQFNPIKSSKPPAPVVDVQPQAQLVLDIQRILNARGFDTGGIDGIAGPKTTEAMRNVQSRLGLPQSGKPSSGLLQMLRSNPRVTYDQSGLKTQDPKTPEVRADEFLRSENTPFYLIPASTKLGIDRQAIGFCTRVCNSSSKENRVWIKLINIEIRQTDLVFHFEVSNPSDVRNYLLFSLSDSPGYSERIHIMDERGNKYYAKNGLEGGKRDVFNRNAIQQNIDRRATAKLYARFPMVNPDVSELSFHSPRLHGHQSAWAISNISVWSEKTLPANSAKDRLTEIVATDWIERKSFTLNRGRTSKEIKLLNKSCLVVLGEYGSGSLMTSYKDSRGTAWRMSSSAITPARRQEAQSITFRCLGQECTVDYAVYPIEHPNCALASLIND